MRFVALFLALSLTACANLHETQEAKLSAAISEYTDQASPEYRHAFVDLNGDGIEDAIVLLRGMQWCGSGGCTMLIMQGSDPGYAFLSRSTVTNEPIRVSRARSDGWRALVVRSNGKDRTLRYQDRGYPLNPSVQDLADKEGVESARTVIHGN